MSRREEILAQMDALRQELKKLESRPPEPENDPAIVYFELAFRANGTTRGRIPVHKLVGFRSRSLWYVVGSGASGAAFDAVPQATSWDKLMDWIAGNGGTGLWLAGELVRHGTVKPFPPPSEPTDEAGRTRG